MLEHDLFRKPVPTFRDHALGQSLFRSFWRNTRCPLICHSGRLAPIASRSATHASLCAMSSPAAEALADGSHRQRREVVPQWHVLGDLLLGDAPLDDVFAVLH